MNRSGADIQRSYSNENYEAFALLCFALHDWELGKFTDAGQLLTVFMQSGVPESDKWIDDYKSLASFYLADANLIAPIEAALLQVKDAAGADTLMAQVKTAKETAATGNLITDRLQAIQTELISKGAKVQ